MYDSDFIIINCIHNLSYVNYHRYFKCVGMAVFFHLMCMGICSLKQKTTFVNLIKLFLNIEFLLPCIFHKRSRQVHEVLSFSQMYEIVLIMQCSAASTEHCKRNISPKHPSFHPFVHYSTHYFITPDWNSQVTTFHVVNLL